MMFQQGKTVQGHSFRLNRNENPSRCAKSVQRKDSDVRRTVDKNDIEVLLVAFKEALDSRMGFQVLRYEGNGTREVKASWNDGEIVYSRGMNEGHLRRKGGFEESAQRERRFERLFRKKTCRVTLRVRVDEEYAKTFMSENSRKVDARGGFAHSAFLIGDRNHDHPAHTSMLFCIKQYHKSWIFNILRAQENQKKAETSRRIGVFLLTGRMLCLRILVHVGPQIYSGGVFQVKKWILWVLVVCLCVGVLAGMAGAAEAAKKYKIATVVKVDGIAWFNRMRIGVEEFGKETGHEMWMVGPAKADAAEQVQIVENLIAQGVDAICIVPFSVEAVEPVLKKARDSGIIVISHEASNQINADVIIEAFDNHAYGANIMKNLAKSMGGKGQYLCTVGSLTSKSQNEWIDGAIAYQKEHFPEMSEVAPRIETYDDATIDYQKIKEALIAYPDLKGICGGPMPTSAGAGLAIEERGLQGKVFFSGTGLPSIAGQYLESGAIQTIHFWDPKVAGIAMNKLALLVLDGKKDEIADKMDLGLEGFRSLKQDAEKPNLFYGAGWVDVTKENMAEYDF